MDTLDQPIDLHIKNGKVFPPNVVLMGYIFLGVSVFIFVFGLFFIGIGGLLVSLFICFTTYGIKIHPETFTIEEYTAYLGFIPIKKSFDYRKFSIITVVPTRQSNTMYARNLTSTTQTNYYHSVCLLNKNYRNKKDLTKFEQKHTSVEVAKMLAHMLSLKYFDYDPKVIREKMLGR